jgi:hypothetical protein
MWSYVARGSVVAFHVWRLYKYIDYVRYTAHSNRTRSIVKTKNSSLQILPSTVHPRPTVRPRSGPSRRPGRSSRQRLPTFGFASGGCGVGV